MAVLAKVPAVVTVGEHQSAIREAQPLERGRVEGVACQKVAKEREGMGCCDITRGAFKMRNRELCEGILTGRRLR